MHRGYTKRWRKRWDKGYHQDQLLWCMMDYFIDFATYKDKEFPFIWRGALVEMVQLKRGQCFFTFKGIKDVFNSPLNPVSRKMVRRRVEILKKIGFLEHQQGHHYQIITILNYSKYNPSEEEKEHQRGRQPPADGTPTAHQPATTNNYKKDNNNKYTSLRFAEWWSLYPKKNEKKKCLEKWKRRNLDSMADKLIEDVRRRIKTRKWQDGYIPNPLTYINGDRWDDEIEETISEPSRYLTDEEKLEQWKRSRSHTNS